MGKRKSDGLVLKIEVPVPPGYIIEESTEDLQEQLQRMVTEVLTEWLKENARLQPDGLWRDRHGPPLEPRFYRD